MASNTKLKTGDYIDLSDVTKDQLDACVAVAEAQGLIPTQLVVNEGLKARDINSINKYFGVFEDGKYIGFSDTGDSDLITALTLEQWLFSNAPDWAVDIRSSYSGNGSFWYTDKKKKCQEVNIAGYGMSSSTERIMKSPVIATRTPQEEKWMPKVGDTCLWGGHNNNFVEITILAISDDEWWLKGDDFNSIVGNPTNFKPLPPSLEEQLAHDILSMNYRNLPPQTIAHRLIEKGWKK